MSPKTLTGRMSKGMSLQFNCASVILHGALDPDTVITFAYMVGAIADDEQAPDALPLLVIDFRYTGEQHDASTGAVLYQEETFRSLLERDLQAAASQP